MQGSAASCGGALLLRTCCASVFVRQRNDHELHRCLKQCDHQAPPATGASPIDHSPCPAQPLLWPALVMAAHTAADGAGAAAASAVGSLSMADSSLPLWFKPELFLAPEFNPAAYVADLKRYVRAGTPGQAGGSVGAATRPHARAHLGLLCFPCAGAPGDAQHRAALAPERAEEQAGGGGCCAHAGGAAVWRASATVCACARLVPLRLALALCSLLLKASSSVLLR